MKITVYKTPRGFKLLDTFGLPLLANEGRVAYNSSHRANQAGRRLAKKLGVRFIPFALNPQFVTV